MHRTYQAPRKMGELALFHELMQIDLGRCSKFLSLPGCMQPTSNSYNDVAVAHVLVPLQALELAVLSQLSSAQLRKAFNSCFWSLLHLLQAA